MRISFCREVRTYYFLRPFWLGGNKIIILPGKAMRRDKPELKINENSVRSENLI